MKLFHRSHGCLLMLSVLLLPHGAAQAQIGGVFPHPYEIVDHDPVGLLDGDLDGDGRPDLVVAVSGTDEVGVLLGNGDGTFAAAVRYAVGSVPGWMASGDFDGDGATDLAVANLGGSDLSILLGNGDGTFEPEQRFGQPGGGQAFFVVAGDFNEDGSEDLIVTELGGNLLFPGNGDGTFGAEIRLAGTSRAAAVADFNGDGHDDFAIHAGVHLGQGDFSFVAGDAFAVPTYPTHIVAADLDGDQVPDLVTAQRDPDEVTVRLGIGDGTFGPSVAHSVADGGTPSHVLVEDRNGDGLNDLLVSHGPLGTGLSLLLGAGGGSFGDPVWARMEIVSTYTIAAADFDGDGFSDVAHGQYGGVSVGVLQGTGDGGFVLGLSSPVGDDPQSIAVADLDADGRADLVTANNGSGDVSVLLADGAGTFAAESRFTVATNPRGIVVAELTSDGIPDLAITSSGSNVVSILAGDGAGSFVALAPVPTGLDPVDLASGDLNGDSNNDLVVANQASNRLSILLGDGAGAFASPPMVAVGGSPRGLALGDLDGDDALDVVVAAFSANSVAVRLGNGDGTFVAAASVTTGFQPSDVALGDIDGDLIVDLVVVHSSHNEDILVFLGNGDGTFAPNGVLGVAFSKHAVELIDLDGDAVLDLITDGGIVAFRGLGNGAFEAPRYFTGSLGATGDFNLDGRLDVVGLDDDVDLRLNRSGPRALTFLDAETLTWPAALGATSYNLYRGSLAELVDADENGLPDGGYGTCITALDDDARDTSFIDSTEPVPGGFFYLTSTVDADGEHDLGSTSTGLARLLQPPCP